MTMATAVELSTANYVSSSSGLFNSEQKIYISNPKPQSFTSSFSGPILPTLSTSSSSNVSYRVNAISYDDIVTSVSSPSSSDLETSSDFVDGVTTALDSVTSFVSQNPLAVIAGVAAIGLPFIVSSIFSQGKKTWSTVSARDAFNNLALEDAQLLDIRDRQDVKIEGTPDLRSLKKRVFQIPYTASENEAFIEQLVSRFKDPSNTTLYILDQFDGNSLSVAKLCTANGFKFAYAIKDGAEGPNGWRKNELPWLLPRRGFTLDLGNLKDVIDSTFGENTNLVPATLGVAAAAGVGFVVFSEAETALQLLGSAALVQLFVKKLLFAKDRQKTLQELQTFLDTKVAPKELVDEIKGVAKVFLPKYEDAVDSKNGAVRITKNQQEVEAKPVNSPVVIDVEKERVTSENSVVTEVENKNVEIETVATSAELSTGSNSATSADLPRPSRPLSPYTLYPGLKPPTPPSPSRP